MQQDVIADAGLARGAWPGRDNDFCRMKRFDFRNGDFIIADNLHGNIRSNFTYALHKVVSEGVVIVDQQNHGRDYTRDWSAVKRVRPFDDQS